MSVRLSIWRAERIDRDHFALYRANRYMGYVACAYGEWRAYAAPGLGKRKGSRIGRATARAAAWHYFSADAAGAVDAAVAKEVAP